MSNAFTTLYRDLDRQGPGEPADVDWAAGAIGLSPEARICDAGCGTGGDIPALLDAAPRGTVTAIDSNKAFIDRVLMDFSDNDRVSAFAGNIAKLKGPYDLIWSAGALYFLGVVKGLKAWRPALSKTGIVAFSEPCSFASEASDAVQAFWGKDYDDLSDAAGIDAKVRAAGFATLATRRVSEAGWQAYYGPLAASIARMRPDADEEMMAVLDVSEAEISAFERVKDETGYLLSVVRPV